MPNKTAVSFRITEEEREILETYAKATSRRQTELIREFIRSLAKKPEFPQASVKHKQAARKR